MLQPVPQFAEKLDVFRTEVLDRIAPTDNNNKNLAANVVMDELLDSTVGLDNFVIPEVIVSSTRAGLYVYLNASVSAFFLFITTPKEMTKALTIIARRPTNSR